MRDKIIGFIISVVCFIISLGFVKGQAMALPFVPTDWTWEMYQGLHMLGDLIANDVNFDIPDWVDFNDFDDVKAFLEMIYNEGKKKVAYASIIADMCVGTWQNFLETGEVSLPFSESTIKRTHNTGFFQHIADTINSIIPEPDVNYLSYINRMNSHNAYSFYWDNAPTSTFYGGRKGGLDRYCTPYAAYNTVSWFAFDTNGNIGYAISYYNYGWDMSSYVCTTGDVKTLQINSDSNGQYTGVISDITIVPFWRDNYGETWCSAAIRYNNGNYASSSIYWSSNGGLTNKSLSYTGSLSQVLQYFQDRCKNVNIYVDGNPWALVGGGSIDNPLGVVIPQNVIDEVENGKISGLVIDATLPDTDNLVGSIDLGVVMDELREAQTNGRQATLDGVRTKDGVKALDGTVVGTVSKAVSIDVPSTASLVTAADEWGYIPYYPEIPSAFSGTTILSELIDATQTIVPNELIMAIWGLVIILFIIALINIFHK